MFCYKIESDELFTHDFYNFYSVNFSTDLLSGSDSVTPYSC